MPLYASAVLDTENKQVKTQVTLVKSAIVAYQAQHGVYPTTLAELNLPPDLVNDPYVDVPLIYAPPPGLSDGVGKITLYSVGPNRRNDGAGNDAIRAGLLQTTIVARH